MGSWNGTCAISNLPIEANTPVKLIFLKGEYNYSGLSAFYEPTSFMSPTFYPIDAVYDGNGSVEKIAENWNTDIINDYLLKRFGSEIIHHQNYKDDTETVKTHIVTVVNLIERSLCFDDIFNQIKDNEKANDRLSFILIRKDIWDRIIKIMSEFKDNFYSHNDKNCMIPKTLKEYLLKKFQNKIIFSKENYERFVKISNGDERILKEAVYMSLQNSPFKVDSIERDSLLTYKEYHNFYLETNDDFLKADILNEWIESELINHFMFKTRKAWSVHPGAGNEGTNYELYVEFGKAITDIAQEKINNQDND